MSRKSLVRIGCGAGFSGDRIDPAIDLAERGALDYLVFECLAERTIALAVRARREDPQGGFDPLLEARMRAVLPAAVRAGTKIISNMGAANPVGAARRTAEIAGELGLSGLKIAAVTGDDVLGLVLGDAALTTDLGRRPDDIISANAYLGCEPIVEALAAGAHVVLTGRAADPALFLAPLVHEFGWALEDWEHLGRGVVCGHLLECAGQVTGGYFADPGYKDVPGLARLGFPIAEVEPDGGLTISKLAGTGGAVSVATCTEQLIYELHDPQRYLTPDVAADFSSVRFEAAGPDRVRVRGGGGQARPERLKVSVGYQEGFIGEGQISYAGPGAQARGRLALDILRQRLAGESAITEARFELIGVDAVSVGAGQARAEPPEVRVRVAARTPDAAVAARVGREVEALYTNGPAGGGGATRAATPVIAIASTFIERNKVATALAWENVP